jgi:hypothetical protein
LNALRRHEDYSTFAYQTVHPPEGNLDRWVPQTNTSINNPEGGSFLLANATPNAISTVGLVHQLMYAKLHGALASMAAVDSDEDYFINAETYNLASNILDQFLAATVSPPKIFSHGEDAIVFTWQRHKRELLLTASEGRVSLLEVDPDGNQTVRMKADADSLDFVETLEYLRGKTWPTTTYV